MSSQEVIFKFILFSLFILFTVIIGLSQGLICECLSFSKEIILFFDSRSDKFQADYQATQCRGWTGVGEGAFTVGWMPI